MANKKHNANDVIKAIEGSAGIKTTIAKRLGVHRHTVDRYLEWYASALEAYQDEVESNGDLAEAVILNAIKEKDVNTAKWYAANKLKDRGYAERREHTGANGGPLVIVDWDAADDTD